MKTFTLDGKPHKLDPRVPAGQIHNLVGNRHVGTDDAVIEQMIADRSATWPEEARISAQKYAVYCHRKNQNLVKEFRL